jgi:hypothetical protein
VPGGLIHQDCHRRENEAERPVAFRPTHA